MAQTTQAEHDARTIRRLRALANGYRKQRDAVVRVWSHVLRAVAECSHGIQDCECCADANEDEQ